MKQPEKRERLNSLDADDIAEWMFSVPPTKKLMRSLASGPETPLVNGDVWRPWYTRLWYKLKNALRRP